MARNQQPKKPTAADNRVASRNQKENQASQLSAANVEESPYMDRGDSAAGAGESLEEGQDSKKAREDLRRGALDTQYGTKSSMKTPQKAGQGTGGRASSGGSGASGSSGEPASTPNPDSSEQSSGAERDTMTGSRPGGRS